jgi:hypothetical protein
LTIPELLQTTEALLSEHRERLYPPTVTLSMFMRQVAWPQITDLEPLDDPLGHAGFPARLRAQARSR